MDASEEKKGKIKQTLKETRERRSLQECKVYELKIDYSHLNLIQKEKLKMYFVEAKWLYNYALSSEDIFKYDYKEKVIEKKNKDGEFEEVKLEHLPSQIKQAVYEGLKQNIINLSKAKKKSVNVGRLKYKSEYNTLNLKQAGVTYKITSKNRVKIQGIKKHIKVFGLHQITPDMELANAKLIKKPDGYYIKITTYKFPEGEVDNGIEKKQGVGIDFGISDNLITSDGKRYNVFIEESERLKRLQKKLARQKKGSNNRYKTILEIKKEYQKITNQKNDMANKIVHELFSNYFQVVIQDESLKGWQSGWFGRQVQHSAMGTVKSKLQESKQIHTIDKWLPTTKMCPVCGKIKEKNILSERWFSCECGYEEDRDIKSAKTILKIGLLEIGTGHTDFKPVEKKTSTKNSKGSFASYASTKQEAQGFNLG